MALRILIVEDDGLILDNLVKLSELMGHYAQGCTRASIALDLLKTSSFDLLIADVNLPYVSGIELVKHVSAYPEMQVALTSGEALLDELPDGAWWFPKPFDISDYQALLTACQKQSELTEI